jgi:acyl-CoA dehydrogenase
VSDEPFRFAPSWSDLPFFFSDEHQGLGEELEAKVTERDQSLKDVRTVATRLAQLGLFRLLVPPRLGGRPVGAPAAVDVRALCIARERLAYTSPLADAVFAVQGLGSHAFVLTPAAPRRADFLHEIMTGERVGAFALTEPEAGSDVASMRAQARREGDGWLLDGEKVFISNVGIATHFIVFAHADPSSYALSPGTLPSVRASELPKIRRTISAFLVPSDAPGLTLEATPTCGEHPVGRLVMKDCAVPRDALIDEVGAGMRLALGTLDVFRTSVGAAAVGMARRALDETIARVRTRAQFGKKLAEFQMTQAAVAEMATELDAARLLVYRAAYKKDQGEKARTEVAMAKLYATEAAQRIIDRAVQLHGGLGVTVGSVVEKLYREIRPLRIYEGTSEIQKLIIGSAFAVPSDRSS